MKGQWVGDELVPGVPMRRITPLAEVLTRRNLVRLEIKVTTPDGVEHEQRYALKSPASAQELRSLAQHGVEGIVMVLRHNDEVTE